MIKILILSLSLHDNDVYSKFYKTQLDTWESIIVPDVTTYFFFGNGEKCFFDGKEIITDVSEGYFNCGYKTLKAFEMIKNLKFDFLFRTNSSSYVDKILLKKYLLNVPRNNFYSGVVGNFEGISYGSGCGYALSRDLFDLIINKKEKWNHYYVDDISVGDLLSNEGISVTPAKRYNVNLLENEIPIDFYHYRFKNFDRNLDCEFMYKLHEQKINYHSINI